MKEELIKINKIILASASPRRKELLSHFKIPFEIIVSNIDEVIEKDLSFNDLVQSLALQKAQAVFNTSKSNSSLFLGADTIVVSDEVIFGKPKSRKEAHEILLQLENKTHSVYTGVSLFSPAKTLTFSVETKVSFKNINKFILEDYLDSGEFSDKAGAYGIQGMALTFIETIKGSYSNVVGLPLSELDDQLSCYFEVANWRKIFKK